MAAMNRSPLNTTVLRDFGAKHGNQGRDETSKIIGQAADEIDRLREALHECVCGWHDVDARIRYVEVQIDKDEMRRIYGILGMPEPKFK